MSLSVIIFGLVVAGLIAQLILAHRQIAVWRKIAEDGQVQVDNALVAAKKWQDAFETMERACLKSQQAFDTLYGVHMRRPHAAREETL